MRALVQRVSQASVEVEQGTIARIGPGLLVFVGIAPDDGESDLDWLARKIVQLRIFSDEAGKINRSLLDEGGELLAVSQFTLHASTAKGNRPSFTGAAPSAMAEPMFLRFVEVVSALLGKPIPTGVFGADMRVASVNDGPVTIWLDSRQRE